MDNIDNNIMEVKHKICSNILRIKKIENIEQLHKCSIKCPVCKRLCPFSEFVILTRSHKQQPEDNNETLKQDNPTIVNIQNNNLGRLVFNPPTLPPVTLKEGINIIGRKCNGSTANIQVPIENDGNRTSREHIKIEVKMIKGKGYIHTISLCKERVNKTYYKDKILKYGDCYVLKNGDVLKLPDTTITFTQDDPNGTVYEQE